MNPLTYHRYPFSGKFKTVPSKSLANQGDLSLAYSPGVAEVCQAIVADPRCVNDYTIRRHLIAVISNGTAVLGLGNIGPLAAKPVMEGKAVLFQKFAHLNAIDLEIEEEDPKKLIDIIASLAPSFGAINLEDIKAPECFEVEQELIKRLSIPVFHDDQHGTAIIVSAALTNALYSVGKTIESVKCVVVGAGAGALACLHLLVKLGMRKENIFVCDTKGLIHRGRSDLSVYKAAYAQETDLRHLHEVIEGADVFLGLSRPESLTAEHVNRMAQRPIVFALANPVPEIWPQEVYSARPDALVGTGRSDLPNQVNNLMCFPYIFKGALDVGASQINDEMKIACVAALSTLARQGFSDVLGAYKGENKEFSAEYFIPKAFDPRLLVELPIAVAKAAIESGIAQARCLKEYRKELIKQAYHDMPLLCALLLHPPASKPVLFYEVMTPETISAAQALIRYGVAQPGFVGDDTQITRQLAGYPLLKGCPILSREELTSQHRCIKERDLFAHESVEGYVHDGALVLFSSQDPPLWVSSVVKKMGWTVSTDAYHKGDQVREGRAYINVGQHYNGMSAPYMGPFGTEGSPQCQYIQTNASLKDVIEKSALVLLMGD